MELLLGLLLIAFSLTLSFVVAMLLSAAFSGDRNITSTLGSSDDSTEKWVMPVPKLESKRRVGFFEKIDKNDNKTVREKLEVKEFVGGGCEPPKNEIRGEKPIEEVSGRGGVEGWGDNLVDGSLKREKLSEIELEAVKVETDSTKDVLVYGREEGSEYDKNGDDGVRDKLFDLEDDWEGIERTELEKVFGAAVVFVGSANNADLISTLGSDVKTQLYGLHKIATQGPCHEPQPMALKLSARAKWNAWQRLGNMDQEVAMELYITLLSRSIPGWMQDNFMIDNRQVFQEVEACRKLASDSKASPSIQPGAVKKRKSGIEPCLEGLDVSVFGAQTP